MGTAGGLCQEHPGGSAPPPAVPGHPRGPSRSARVGARRKGCGWAGDGAWEAPGERVGMGGGTGWHGEGAMHSHTHAHTRRSGNIKLHCR